MGLNHISRWLLVAATGLFVFDFVVTPTILGGFAALFFVLATVVNFIDKE